MKKLLLGLAALPLLAGAAAATEPLSDAQLDRITAGAGVCLVSVPTDGMTCLVTTGGIPSALLPAPDFPQTSPTTIIADLQKFFNIPPNPQNPPGDLGSNVGALPIPR
jgi:hypothetical protein